MELEAVTTGKDLLLPDLTLMLISLEPLKQLVQADSNSWKNQKMTGIKRE